ncbi:hypothetical protein EJ05DRAFT_502836 [Pseudovirgaria hyperparasitica]|uniref:Mitotic apparatus protein p62 n=1 Tax=Pseudovirgaria hyperparasitica TaxID=470096 RepID=A0A6A6W2W0_9PEZI|nr:uncharacterized protein EJ05DRAFT_502836 [Pseudovirgaria hyperparasitica]KAF2755371.1 hypothetical protein EJ05DRAFT_502836 [Pseudovirgaria hyperparasitica]
MTSQHILRIPIVDDDSNFVIVNAKSNGSHDFDLYLSGTENEAPYELALKDGNIDSLQTSKNKLPAAEWRLILSHILLERQTDPNERDAIAGIEVVATVSTESSLEIVIRKLTGNITIRLGSIVLKHNDDIALDLFEWTGIASQAGAAAQSQMLKLQGRINDQSDAIAKLQKQLEELVTASREQEDAMAAKYAMLLNEKKAKIRDQQRLLATAKVDPQIASEVQLIRETTKPRKPAPSRASKRKAPAKSTEPDPTSDDDMQTAPESEDEDVKPAQMTPEPSDTETEDEDEDAGGTDAPVHSQPEPVDKPTRTQPGRGTRETRGKALGDPGVVDASTTKATGKEPKAPAEEAGKKATSLKDLPPPRELPFMKPSAASKASTGKAQVVRSMDEDDTDDDEL